MGQLGSMPYAITRKCAGQRLNTLPPPVVESYLPALLDVLDAIHGSEMPLASGSGLFDDHGVGMFPTWQRSLEFVREEEPDWEFYGKWHALFERTFLERDVFDRVYARMEALLDYCPEQRRLAHGGVDYSNVLVEHGEITAVLDWVDARYGDPLFDIANLDFWDPERGVREQYARRAGMDDMETHFEERLLCYQCNMGPEAMKFFAKTDQKSGYLWVRERVLGLLGA